MTRTQAERLTLRPVTMSDVDDLFRIYGDPATNTFNPAGPYPNITHAKTVLARWVSHWKENAFGNWAISLHEAPEKVIGFGGLSISTYAGITINNLGYRFATEAWGKGWQLSFHAMPFVMDSKNFSLKPSRVSSEEIILHHKKS